MSLLCVAVTPKIWVKMHTARLMPLPISRPIHHHMFGGTETVCNSSRASGWSNSVRNVERLVSRLPIILQLCRRTRITVPLPWRNKKYPPAEPGALVLERSNRLVHVASVRLPSPRNARHKWRLNPFTLFIGPTFFRFAFHDRRIPILTLDPVARAAGRIRGIATLQHDPLQAELAGMMEDKRALLVVQMLIEPNGPRVRR